MKKLGFGVFPICMLTAAVLGCGSASPNVENQAAGPQNDSSFGAAAKAQSDPKVAEAAQRCAMEIEQAEMQPPDQLSKLQIAACMYASTPEVQKCSKDAPVEIVLKVVVNKDGSVANAFPVGDSADSPEAGCVAEVIKGVKFPKFKGLTQQNIKYPFTVGN